jgi:hypothetical protein
MKPVQLFVIILTVLTFLFVLYHINDEIYVQEGYDNVPSCGSSNSRTSRVPSCYTSVQKDDYLDYKDIDYSDYTLKTKIVTPICPSDPYHNMRYNTKHHYGTDIRSSGRILTDVSANTPVASNTLTAKDTATKAPEPAQDTTKKEPAPANAGGPSKDASIAVPSMPSATTDDYMLSVAQKPTVPKPANDKEKSEPGTCPPCPACERCPEPTVDCKRVVKYKDQQYPVPLISDFSHFSRY